VTFAAGDSDRGAGYSDATVRTRPWGYRAREIVDFLVDRNYCWFSLKADGRLQPAATDLDLYDANLVALPAERAEGISKMLAETERG